jgi:hypothetical protein
MEKNEELRVLKRRVASLEIAHGRFNQVMAGFAQVLDLASKAKEECGECGNDSSAMKTCAVEECPCGLPATIEEQEDDVSDTDD